MTSRLAKSRDQAALFSLRLPPDVHAELALIAHQQGKSLNSFIVELLKEKLKGFAASTGGDPLAEAYQAAEAAELNANAVKQALTKLIRKK